MTDEEFHQRFRTMTAAAMGLHELFTSYIRAGFTRQEAFELCREILRATVQQQQQPAVRG